VSGELRDRRAAVLPAAAALGGMVVPALLYTAVNLGSGFEHGWGVPMATDIAFAVGVLALVGPRVPTPLRVFVLTLAIVDDIGAIVVIALFYGTGVDGRYLVVAAALAAVAGALWCWRAVPPIVPALVGIGLWMAVYASGIHATIAGVVLGLLVPAGAVGERLERALHPWVSFAVLPVFALANAGVPLGRAALADHPRVLVGVGLGLVAGKVIGVTAGAWLAVRFGAGILPSGVGWRLLAAAAVLTGIGFTVALFITGLAFETESAADAAKLGILMASFVAAVAGALAVRAALPHAEQSCKRI
jgi:NhaA family Na+:H+ antiporter